MGCAAGVVRIFFQVSRAKKILIDYTWKVLRKYSGNSRTLPHLAPASSCRNFSVFVLFLYANLFRLELGPDLVGKIFSNLSRTNEIRIDLWRDLQKLVYKTVLKFDLQDLCAVIISHGAQNPGLDGLSFQEYHYSVTRALNG
jgi:hypothetical protein